MTLRLAGSTSGYTEIDCPSVGGNNTLVLPTGNGSSGQVLSTNGSGALSWVDGGVAAGAVLYVASSTAPTGWLKANGAAISRTTYATLFTQIGTTFGVGDGSTTFNLPDLRGEFIRSFSDGRAVDSGRSFGSAQAATQIWNGIDTYVGGGGVRSGGEDVISDGARPHSGHAFAGSNANTSITGSQGVRPRNIALLAIIKF